MLNHLAVHRPPEKENGERVCCLLTGDRLRVHNAFLFLWDVVQEQLRISLQHSRGLLQYFALQKGAEELMVSSRNELLRAEKMSG